jgi:hypothetical protein
MPIPWEVIGVPPDKRQQLQPAPQGAPPPQQQPPQPLPTGGPPGQLETSPSPLNSPNALPLAAQDKAEPLGTVGGAEQQAVQQADQQQI